MSNTNNNNEDYSLSQFQRNHYFYGKLMTVIDFKTEQNYMNGKRHLLNRVVNGAGLIRGLALSDVDVAVSADNNVKIKFNKVGTALDPWGKEIVFPAHEKPVYKEEGGGNLTTTDLIAVNNVNNETESPDQYYYLYLEYDEQLDERVSSPFEDPDSEDPDCEGNRCPNRVIENFKVIASTQAPETTVKPEFPVFEYGTSADEAEQELKEWLQKRTAKLCETPNDGKVFLLALKKGDSSAAKDTEETARCLSFVTNNRAFSELLARHLSDFGNPHKTTHGEISEVLPVDPSDDDTVRNKHVSNEDAKRWDEAADVGGLLGIDGVENPGGNIDLVQENSITITPNDEANTITIGETHSANKNNPHNVGMSQLMDFNTNNKIIDGLPAPTQENHAANKGYVDGKTGGTISSSLDIGDVTTSHTRQINVSYSSTASGSQSQVNASYDSTASNFYSQVNASASSTASNTYSQVNASVRTQTASNYTMCGGFGAQGGPSHNNRKWELNSYNGNITCAAINGHPPFSNYGEYFENLKMGEIKMGVLVALEGAKVRPANKDEDFIGVVSGTAAIRLGDSPFCWQGRYMKDEWGRPLYEEIKDPAWQPKTVPDKKWKPKKGQTEADRPMIPIETEKDRPTIRVQKENPHYEPKRDQVPRSERPKEWTLVGLLGQVYVRCDETIKPGDFVKSKGKGIGTKSGGKTKLRAMKVTKHFDGKYAIVYCLLI